MEIIFTRTGERTYTTEVRRDDGVLLHVPTNDRPATLPHDVAHCIVERGVGLERGFWGCVAAGAMFGAMRVVEGRRRPHASEHSQGVIKDAGTQLTQAEIFVLVMSGAAHEGLGDDWSKVRARLDEAWRPFREPMKSVDAADGARICRELREAEKRWEALAVGERMTFTWESPRKRSRKRARRTGAA